MFLIFKFDFLTNGGNLCSNDQGIVTCSCSEENYKYDSGSNTCFKDCERNNGGCVDSECINNRCVACGKNEYFNVVAEECQTAQFEVFVAETATLTYRAQLRAHVQIKLMFLIRVPKRVIQRPNVARKMRYK